MANLNNTLVQGDLRVTGTMYGTQSATVVSNANLAVPPISTTSNTSTVGDYSVYYGANKYLPDSTNNYSIHTVATNFGSSTYRATQIATASASGKPSLLYERSAVSSDGVNWTFGDWKSVAFTDHTHGNIQNGGTLQTNDITIANGDKLVVTDADNSNKIARTSVSFDGSTTTTALTPKGTFESFAKSSDITTAIQALDVSSKGGAGKYISAISEADGKISATATTMDTAPTSSSTNAVTSGGVKTALDGKVDIVSLTSVTDWNSITSVGVYSISQATGVLNSPESGLMTLIVMKSASFITQTAVGKDVYKRCYSSNSWTSWQRCNEFIVNYNSVTPSFANTVTAYATGANIVCLDTESGQGGTFDHIVRLQEVVYDSGSISKFVFAISRCLNSVNIGDIVKYEFSSSGWTKTASKVAKASGAENADVAEYFKQQHDNEVNFKNIPNSGTTSISRVWLNYRDGDTDAANPDKLITEYVFGNRNKTSTGVKLVADEFSGKANSAVNYISGNQTLNIDESINSKMGAYMFVTESSWKMFGNDGTEIDNGNVGTGKDIYTICHLDQVIYKALGHDGNSSIATRRPVLDIINYGEFVGMTNDQFKIHPYRLWLEIGGPSQIYAEVTPRTRIRLTLINTGSSSQTITIQAGGRYGATSANYGWISVDGDVKETTLSGDPYQMWDIGSLNEKAIGTLPSKGSKTWEILYWKDPSTYMHIDYREYVLVNTIK